MTKALTADIRKAHNGKSLTVTTTAFPDGVALVTGCVNSDRLIDWRFEQIVNQHMADNVADLCLRALERRALKD